MERRLGLEAVCKLSSKIALQKTDSQIADAVVQYSADRLLYRYEGQNFLRQIGTIEFSHSLDPQLPLAPIVSDAG